MNHLQDAPLDLAGLLAETDTPDCGALVVFGGTVRNENNGRSVDGISYTAHLHLAEKILQQVEQDCLDRFGIQSCRIVHRHGQLKVHELSVLVVVRAAHRAAAFEAARHAIDMLKERVPIWKEEHYTDGKSEYLEGVPLRAPTAQNS